MPVGKLTARRYGSVSAIGNCVTDVTRERSAGTRHRQQAKKRSKNLSRCCSRDIENGFDREDVIHSVEADVSDLADSGCSGARNSCFGARVHADIDRESRMGCRGET
jgi:hypothetical protein